MKTKCTISLSLAFCLCISIAFTQEKIMHFNLDEDQMIGDIMPDVSGNGFDGFDTRNVIF